ncbi:Major facilitator superfamily domain general substrate transporter [Penicillium concentricum]|uniref:Major facilitator superfamily domain general substrate transporter n=1 Tax=Penicillium concentricum TaxID=293559 RepID=A0A9W9S4T0_9EURO|nr:Major facilitator superfamily domain general substrate transporter [Penicillium concentricum]KAJ5372063.1 Major facilitator superfamily domain general substrate transporter [Penicillium concentricum]
MSTGIRPSGHPMIDNPLIHQEYSQLEAEVEQFYERLQLESVVDLKTLIKGASLAKQRWGHATPGLTPLEILTIKEENSETSLSFLHTRGLLVTIMATACAAITQGWQQSTINGSSLLDWHEAFDLDKADEHDLLLIGLINAAPWLSGSVIGTWLSDPLQEKFGRRPALFIAAVFCVALVIGTALCTSWESLLVCRIILGVGIGSKASIAPIFAAEAAPDRHRGQVLMLWQLFDAFGIFLGFLCAFMVMENWRALLATAIIPAIVLLFLVFICPESPRYLIQRNRYADAYKSLLELRGTPIQAARDLYYIHAQLQTEAITVWNPQEGQSWWSELEQLYAYQKWIKRGNFFKRMMYLATNPRTRRACTVASIVMISQQLCGINVLAFYSSSVFQPEDFSSCLFPEPRSIKTQWYNFGFGLANFLFTFPAYRFIDSRGRRPLLLVSFIGMFLSLIAVSGFFLITDCYTRSILVAVFSIIFFVFFYSIGAGPIPFTLSAEVFPLCVREVGMSFSVMINFLGLGILVLFVPLLSKGFDGPANLLFFFSFEHIGTHLNFLLVRRATKEQVLDHAPFLRPLYRKSSRQEDRESTTLQDREEV